MIEPILLVIIITGFLFGQSPLARRFPKTIAPPPPPSPAPSPLENLAAPPPEFSIPLETSYISYGDGAAYGGRITFAPSGDAALSFWPILACAILLIFALLASPCLSDDELWADWYPQIEVTSSRSEELDGRDTGDEYGSTIPSAMTEISTPSSTESTMQTEFQATLEASDARVAAMQQNLQEFAEEASQAIAEMKKETEELQEHRKSDRESIATLRYSNDELQQRIDEYREHVTVAGISKDVEARLFDYEAKAMRLQTGKQEILAAPTVVTVDSIIKQKIIAERKLAVLTVAHQALLKHSTPGTAEYNRTGAVRESAAPSAWILQHSALCKMGVLNGAMEKKMKTAVNGWGRQCEHELVQRGIAIPEPVDVDNGEEEAGGVDDQQALTES